NAIADILLRFKTDIITSDLLKINPSEAIARAEFINKSKNNLGTLLLTKDEVMQQFVTSIAGLDKVVAQLQESVAIAARMPAVKLLGLTPSGFNATGDYDLNSFYDELESMQKSVLEPILLKLYRNLALEYNSALESEINIEFNQLKDKDMLQEAQALNFILDSCLKGIEAGIITQEQALKIVKDNGFWVNVNFEKENTDLSEFESLGIENETQEL
ncbi:phage portal protein, partial [uncultured Helicobacter sp.]